MIELIINCYVINSNNAVKLITADTEWIRINNT